MPVLATDRAACLPRHTYSRTHTERFLLQYEHQVHARQMSMVSKYRLLRVAVPDAGHTKEPCDSVYVQGFGSSSSMAVHPRSRRE